MDVSSFFLMCERRSTSLKNILIECLKHYKNIFLVVFSTCTYEHEAIKVINEVNLNRHYYVCVGFRTISCFCSFHFQSLFGKRCTVVTKHG